MAMGQQKRNRRYMSEINVTPLVDVILVLLIIFMVTAPMMTKGLDVKLPETTAKSLPQKKKPVIVTVDKKGKIFLNKIPVDEKLLKIRLSEIREKSEKGQQVLLRADRTVPYGTVAAVMAAVREAGITDLGLVTQPIQEHNRDIPTDKNGKKRPASARGS
ncbi:MAG TPA: protein TolR [Thermodesulfobacteriaceae bacterium]|nr:protein TolR [Thermodesulfobacteriaceae bacterium]